MDARLLIWGFFGVIVGVVAVTCGFDVASRYSNLNVGMHAAMAQGIVVVASGVWLGGVAGLAAGLAANRHRHAAGWVSLPLGALTGAWSIWLAADSGSPATPFALRLLNPAWIGAPFLWSLPLVAWGACLLLHPRLRSDR
jgi:hypothetical protein